MLFNETCFRKVDWDIATTFIVWCAVVWVWMKETGLPNGKWVLFLTLRTSASSYFLSQNSEVKSSFFSGTSVSQFDIQKHLGMFLDFKEYIQNVHSKFSKIIGLLLKIQKLLPVPSLTLKKLEGQFVTPPPPHP